MKHQQQVEQGTPVSAEPIQAANRFPASCRLLKHADFDRVYKQGQRQFSTILTVFYLRRPDAGGPRVGFTVSRALGGAVDRNRMKRRLREAVRSRLKMLGAPLDVVINPKRSLLTAEFVQIAAEIERAFAVVAKRSATMKAVDMSSRVPAPQRRRPREAKVRAKVDRPRAGGGES
jgi:ribonuclease P protein component